MTCLFAADTRQRSARRVLAWHPTGRAIGSRYAASWKAAGVGLAALMLALSHMSANAALPDPSSAPTKSDGAQQTIDQETTCQDGLRFGITSDKIPLECDAHLIKELVTDTGHREKWQYRKGYLFFDNGVLKAIHQTTN